MREAYRRETQDITPEKKMLNLPAYEVSAERAPEESSTPTANTSIRSQPTVERISRPVNIPQSAPLLLDAFEEEIIDIPQVLADGICSGIKPGHVFMSCKSGSGKTVTVRAMMRAMIEREPVQFVIVDYKGSTWLGLEKTKNICEVRENHDIEKLLKWVQGLKSILNKRIEDRKNGGSPQERIVLIIDEWPSIWDLAREARLEKELLFGLNALIRLGREDKVNVWIVGQSHLTGECGFSRQTQDNCDLFALGRGEDLQSVKKMINDQWIVHDDVTRNELKQQLRNMTTDDRPIAFLAAAGKLGKLPDLRDYTDWTIEVE